MADITAEEVRRIAALANLRLDEGEVARFTAELAKIVAYVEQLNDADPGAGSDDTADGALVLFDDVPRPSLQVEQVGANAPEFRDRAFVVPPVLAGES